MPTVSETLDTPAGTAPSNVVVTITLAGEDGAHVAAAYNADGTIVGRYQTTPDGTGAWSADLARNDELTPAGTAWKIVLSGSEVSAEARYVSVDGAGPFDVEDILTEAPASIASSTYAGLAARVAALEALTILTWSDE